METEEPWKKNADHIINLKHKVNIVSDFTVLCFNQIQSLTDLFLHF